MVDLVPDENPLKVALREIEGLAAYATSYRYATPRISRGLNADELADYLAKVDFCLNALTKRFGVDLAANNKPAERPEPIR
jgi:hypothetical protein